MGLDFEQVTGYFQYSEVLRKASKSTEAANLSNNSDTLPPLPEIKNTNVDLGNFTGFEQLNAPHSGMKGLTTI